MPPIIPLMVENALLAEEGFPLLSLDNLLIFPYNIIPLTISLSLGVLYYNERGEG